MDSRFRENDGVDILTLLDSSHAQNDGYLIVFNILKPRIFIRRAF